MCVSACMCVCALVCVHVCVCVFCISTQGMLSSSSCECEQHNQNWFHGWCLQLFLSKANYCKKNLSSDERQFKYKL